MGRVSVVENAVELSERGEERRRIEAPELRVATEREEESVAEHRELFL